MTRDVRKRALFGFTVAVTVLLLGSTAFACTRWRGIASISGGGKVTTAKGFGNTGMTYCTAPAANSSKWATVGSAGGTIGFWTLGTSNSCPYHLANNGIKTDFGFTMIPGIWGGTMGDPDCMLNDNQAGMVRLMDSKLYTTDSAGIVKNWNGAIQAGPNATQASPVVVTIPATAVGEHSFCLSRDPLAGGTGIGDAAAPQLFFKSI